MSDCLSFLPCFSAGGRGDSSKDRVLRAVWKDVFLPFYTDERFEKKGPDNFGGEVSAFDWEEEKGGEAILPMLELYGKQSDIGAKKQPLFCTYNVEAADDTSMEGLAKQLAEFFTKLYESQPVGPKSVLVFGKRRPNDIVMKGVQMISAALRKIDASRRPSLFISGCADGADAIPLMPEFQKEFGIPVKGYYTPSPFARCDLVTMEENGYAPVQLVGQDANWPSSGFKPGESPMCALDDARLMPGQTATWNHKLNQVMEGQWEWRDTMNDGMAQAALAFLAGKPQKWDATKAQCNVFTRGRYTNVGPAIWNLDNALFSGVDAQGRAVQGPIDAPTKWVGCKIISKWAGI